MLANNIEIATITNISDLHLYYLRNSLIHYCLCMAAEPLEQEFYLVKLARRLLNGLIAVDRGQEFVYSFTFPRIRLALIAGYF